MEGISTEGGRREPWVQRNHVDGPVLIKSDCTLRWLTFSERILLFLGLTNAVELDKRAVLKTWLD